MQPITHTTLASRRDNARNPLTQTRMPAPTSVLPSAVDALPDMPGQPEQLPSYLLRSEIPRIVWLRIKAAELKAGHVMVWSAIRNVLLRSHQQNAPIGGREISDEALVSLKIALKYRTNLIEIGLITVVGFAEYGNFGKQNKPNELTPIITIPQWIEQDNALEVAEWRTTQPTKLYRL